MGLGRVRNTGVGQEPTHTRAIDTFAGIGFSASANLLAATGGAPWEVSGQSYIQVYRGVLSIPGVWRGVNIIADLLGSVPWDAYVRQGDDPERKVSPPPTLLAQPAPPDIRMTTISGMAMDLVLNGNAVALIADRDSRGTITAISPHPAAWSMARRDLGTKRVTYWLSGKEYDSSEVLHFKGLTVPGQVWGMGVIEAHLWHGLRLARDLNRQAGDVNLNAVPTGVYKSGNPDLTSEDAAGVKDGWQRAMSSRTIAVIGANDDFTPLAWNPTDAQLIEARQFSLLEVANMLGLPPSFLGAQSGSSMTYSNIEQESLNLLRYSLAGHLARFEQTFSTCFPSRLVDVRANLNSVLESDTMNRYLGYASAIETGWMRRSEARSKEKLSPIAGIDDAPQTAAVQMKLNKTNPVTSPGITQPKDPGGIGLEPDPGSPDNGPPPATST